MSVTVIISHCFTLFPCVLHFFNLFSIEFVANRALWVALNLSRITHFSCKFLGPKKSACVNVLTYSTSANRGRELFGLLGYMDFSLLLLF